MAKAIQTTIEVPVVTTKQEPAITLTLSIPEAEVLRAIFGRIGGHPETTLRGVTDNINRELSKAGVAHIECNFESGHYDSIYFKSSDSLPVEFPAEIPDDTF